MKAMYVISFLILAYGYRLYKPLPEGISSPVKSAVVIGMFKVVDDISILGSYLGFGSPLNISRAILTYSFRVTNTIPASNFEVKENYINDVRVRMYIPDDAASKMDSAAIIFFHGGGWIFGSLDTHDPPLRILASELNTLIISVDYRLAPEHLYPIPLKDGLAVVKHVIKNAHDYNVNPNKIVVMGDSAGGNMAAVVSLKLRDEKFSPLPKAQVLIYPVTQALDLDLPSYNYHDDRAYGSKMWIANFLVQLFGIDLNHTIDVAENKHVSLQTRKKYAKFLDISVIPEKYRIRYKIQQDYSKTNKDLATKMEKYLTDPYFSPLVAEDLRNLPEALILTVEHDVLRDDGFLYASRLRQFGVPVIHTHYEDSFHTVFNSVVPPLKNDAGIRMLGDIVKYLQKVL